MRFLTRPHISPEHPMRSSSFPINRFALSLLTISLATVVMAASPGLSPHKLSMLQDDEKRLTAQMNDVDHEIEKFLMIQNDPSSTAPADFKEWRERQRNRTQVLNN